MFFGNNRTAIKSTAVFHNLNCYTLKRRKFIKIAIAASALTGLYTWQVEPFWLEFVQTSMQIRNLPPELVGKTLMQISDMHVGNRFDRGYLITSLEKAQKFNPDFVVYTGDFVSYESAEQFDQLKVVLANPVYGKEATLAILGNHDYAANWSNSKVADEIVNILAERQIRTLRNEQLSVNGLNFIGLDDYWGTNFYPEKALDNLNNNLANLVLCHNPDVVDLPIWKDYNGWILSGHTHGGQCKPPFLPPPMLPVKNKKYTAGRIELSGGRTLYINRALGHLHQVRFNVRPEITIFQLETV